MARYPADRFDQVAPARGVRRGAHRLPGPKGRFWRWLLSTVIAAALFSALGVFLVDRYRSEIDLSGDGDHAAVEDLPPYEIPVAEPVDDPKIAITVLNATEQTGLAAKIGKQLRADKKWNVKTESSAATTDVATSTVYYNHLDAEGAARALAADLGVTEVKLSTFYRGNPITVVIGADLIPAAA